MSEGVCADCSTLDPSWASINRGVLVCDECCSVHRSLGRHISYIRSLHSTNWPPALREMVSTLVRKGANSIWEHTLHDSSKVKIKKPTPKDKLHPTKHDFIVAKYKHLALLPRVTLKDSASMTEDLSKQLHASARTSNLETCLRLLSLGADPNYLHMDRGNTPLHVAAHAGQAMQVELLVVHGGNPTALDILGHTPEECARIAGHHQLADRLIECQYELTDKLSFFVSGRKPVHSIGEHILVPPGVNSNDVSEARSKLQELTNEQFEELASDVYDEVDRRESDSIWLTTQQLQNSVAFLPVNPLLSSTRNQGRQKLATLDSNEFCQLVIDILIDTKKRQNISLETGQRSGTIVPAVGMALPEHDYEDVPVEEDEDIPQIEKRQSSKTRSKLTPPIESTYSVVGEDLPLTTTAGGVGTDYYSHLHDHKSSDQQQQNKIAVGRSYSTLGGVGIMANTGGGADYDYTTVSTGKPLLKDTPPPLKPRPVTTYARLHNKSFGAPPLPGEVKKNTEETVTKAKFNIIMEQLRKIQMENEELKVQNEALNLKVAELQKQLNKVIEENSTLRRSSTESATPKTPTSPVPPTAPPIVSPVVENEMPLSPSELQSAHAYSEVNKRKKSNVPPNKGPVKKVVSLPPNISTAVIPPTVSTAPTGTASTSSPLSRTQTPSLSPLPPPPASKSSRQSLPSIDSPTPSTGGKETPIEDSAFDDDQSKESHVTPPPLPPHRRSHPPPPSIALSTTPQVEVLPSLDEVHVHIKSITQCIQDLLKAAQSQRQYEFISCSETISSAIVKLTKRFPRNPENPEVSASIRELEHSSNKLQTECQIPSQQDLAYHTRLVMNSAYDVAKAARFLVTCMEKLEQH